MAMAENVTRDSNDEKRSGTPTNLKVSVGKNNFSCSDCENTFSRFFNLKRHVKKQHPSKYNEFAANSNKTYKYKCAVCTRRYNNLSDLNYHEKKVHMKASEKPVKFHKCPLCGKKFEKKDINLHFEKEHDLTLKTETFTFCTYDEFCSWKLNTENTTNSCFRKESTRRFGGALHDYYSCHRSGSYNPRGLGIREMKTHGSKKINAFCPAMMKVYCKDDECVVTFQSTHVGHENDIAHSNYNIEKKQNLAAKSPFDAILDDVRSSMLNDGSQELHLLTKQDLSCIEKSFNIGLDEVQHPNAAVSVDIWINEIATLDEKSHVLFYKAQGIALEDYTDIEANDFIMIIMNEAQTELLKEFGSESVYIDSTHGLKNHGFELTTLVVLDDFQQGFPCSFMISNRTSETIVNLFLSELKKKTGEFKSTIFMSGIADFLYSAWCNVMGEVGSRFYCSWHVDRTWRNKLKNIKSKETRVETYRLLRTLLEERNEAKFNILLEKTMLNLKEDDETREFAMFFIENYSENVKLWAFCHRTKPAIDCDMYIEKMHKTLNYICYKGRNVRRLDKVIHAIMKFLRDKLFDRLILLSKGNISKKLKVIKQRHKVSENMESVISKTEDEWLISSSHAADKIYVIKENNLQCECQLICLHCKACTHAYTCTCPDSADKWNMCKHIHLLCTLINTKILINEDNRECPANGHFEIVVGNDAESDLSQGGLQNEQASSQEIFAKRKENLKRKLLDMIDSSSAEQFALIEHTVSSLTSKIMTI